MILKWIMGVPYRDLRQVVYIPAPVALPSWHSRRFSLVLLRGVCASISGVFVEVMLDRWTMMLTLKRYGTYCWMLCSHSNAKVTWKMKNWCPGFQASIALQQKVHKHCKLYIQEPRPIYFGVFGTLYNSTPSSLHTSIIKLHQMASWCSSSGFWMEPSCNFSSRTSGNHYPAETMISFHTNNRSWTAQGVCNIWKIRRYALGRYHETTVESNILPNYLMQLSKRTLQTRDII